MRPYPALDAVRLPMNDNNSPVIKAEGLAANLGHDRFEALADGGTAGHQFDYTVLPH
jgi:hypothetical protein